MKNLLAAIPFFLPALLMAQNPEVLVEDYRFGAFGSARSVAVDQFDRIFVTDAQASTVSRYTLNGTREVEIGGPGWNDTQLYEPRGVDASLGIAVYVADWGNHRIVRYDRNLNVQSTYSTADDPSSEVRFGYPLDVVSSEFEDLYILDGENQRVISSRGFSKVTNVFGGIESGDGRLHDPVAMAIDRKHRLFVLEPGRVVVFDSFGNFTGAFGEGAFSDARGIAAAEDRILVVASDALLLFRGDGSLLREWSRETMVLAARTGEFRDAVMLRDRILLLTEESVIIFRQTN